MKTPSKIAEALNRLQTTTEQRQSQVIKSTDMNCQDREILMRTGWLLEVLKGWYILTRPEMSNGDTGPWYANYWDFLALYLSERFGTNYCLSAETSIDLHTGATLIPKQITVIVKNGGSVQKLPFNTSVLAYPDVDIPPAINDEDSWANPKS